MGIPATTGQLRTKIEDMEIGDYGICRLGPIDNSVPNTVSDFGTAVVSEIPVSGHASFSGSFYLVKVGKGLLIADRVVRHTITWDSLNASRLIQGKPLTLGGVNGFLRSLTGGVAFADASGKSSLTDLGFGAFPTNNEWDRYIDNFPIELIQSGKTLDDIFHFDNYLGSPFTWCQDTPSVNISANTNRVYRGINSNPVLAHKNRWIYGVSSYSNLAVGFRPVFEWNEV